MEPWLDSLSEDWNSEPRLSSPASSFVAGKSRNVSNVLAQSQSRIPHLAQNMQRDSLNGSFIRPRSTRGIARAHQKILSERSASSLNLPPSSPRDVSEGKRASTIPLRVSSALSESQSSVQHHTVSSRSNDADTPEWKRRLVCGDGNTTDGFDLFSPSKLEGIFTEPSQTNNGSGSQSKTVEVDAKPWSSLNLAQVPSSSDHFSSYRTSRSRAAVMEALQEVNEEDESEGGTRQYLKSQHNDHDQDLSAISSDLVRNGSVKGLVGRRVSIIEQAPRHAENRASIGRNASNVSRDPRWRTVSGQEEIRNEFISPVTASAKNTIREKAVRNSTDLDHEQLREKLERTKFDENRRPTSRSSDHEISYMGEEVQHEKLLHEEPMPELTSISLPEDLSMGTQDLGGNSSFINGRRILPSTESSLVKPRLKSIVNHSQLEDDGLHSSAQFRSSPPPYDIRGNRRSNQGSSPETSVIRHSPSPTRPSSIGSPLKLFGNKDTYTSNKLLRVLTQYEQDRTNLSETPDMTRQETPVRETSLHMSQFGRGELDGFYFEKEVQRPQTAPEAPSIQGERIFTDVGELKLNGILSRSKAAQRVRTSLNESVLEDKLKRITSSPAKDRTPKRRRTLLKDELCVQGVGVKIKIDEVSEKVPMAGRKRKDARPGEDGSQADPKTLATRSILQPRAGSRTSSAASRSRSVSHGTASTAIRPSGELASALAAELESFAKGVSESSHGSRKPSLATKDYMEEANKVMEFIRARGKPKSSLSDIKEPSELDPDSILDVDIDDDSTKESFSRPPSRDHPVRPWEDRRIAKHDPQTASQLKKYQEPDDLDLLASTSAIGTFNLVDNRAADEAAQVPVPQEEQESSPPNIRISNPPISLRQRQQSPTTNAEPRSGQSFIESSRRTIASGSSSSSGHKGVISSGTVSIPENVGMMTFDREKQLWVKQHLAAKKLSHLETEHTPRSNREATLDDDPFEDIPDLSVDEQQEAEMRKEPRSSRPSTAETSGTVRKAADQSPTRNMNSNTDLEDRYVEDFFTQAHPLENENPDQDSFTTNMVGNDGISREAQLEKLAASKHEEMLHEGIPSLAPERANMLDKQPRVVTIAFSSPIAHTIPAARLNAIPTQSDELEDESDDENFLPPDDSDYEDYVPTPRPASSKAQYMPTESHSSANPQQQRQSQAIVLNQRPVSPIEEDDDDSGEQFVRDVDEGTSLVHLKPSTALTPRATNIPVQAEPVSTYKGASILCLTPLSEFTIHHADKAKHYEESFVAARPHPKALLQAHGQLALSKDEMVKAITDAALDEPFWERIRRLDLTGSNLTSLDALREYCPVLEDLSLGGNKICQLNGLPSSVRRLCIARNRINDFTSWAHLNNLQHVDVSENELESLESFSSLLHLRDLKLVNNQIRDIEGILDLSGLVRLDLSGNHLTKVDFEGSDLPCLEELNLSDNKLTTVLNVHCLPRIRTLKLDGNHIKELNMASAMTDLKQLSVAKNDLSKFDLAPLPSIECLNVDENCIKSIHGLSAAHTLRVLSARDQRQSHDIVRTILATSNECEYIFLSSNALQDGSLSLPVYPHYNLRQLELAACGIRALPQDFGEYFPNCRSLNLNFNAIEDLSPLLGCIKLGELTLVENRVKRLRRTCLTFSRLTNLTSLDIRDNPLTVGFYPPERNRFKDDAAYLLTERTSRHERNWLDRLDETTCLRRRMTELLLAETCKNLKHLDGAHFGSPRNPKADLTFSNLLAKGILMKPDQLITSAAEPSGQEKGGISDRSASIFAR